MIRVLLIIALIYVVLVYLPRSIRRSMTGTPMKEHHSARPKPKEGTTVTRVEEPKPRVLDTSDASDAHFEEVTMLLIALLFPFTLNAQNISVKSFRLLETDLTANLEGTKEIDQNGETAALIKVITTETGFVFDVGMLGIVKQVQKVGEIWVYVPHGIQRISINHQKLGRLAQPYYFNIPIQQARTYELELTTNRVRTIVEEDAGGGFLSLQVTPASAIVFIDDQLQNLKADGTLSVFLLYGEHSYRIEAPGHKAETGTVTIDSEETRTLALTLQSNQSAITFVTDMVDAEIWVNNELKGTGHWTGNLAAGAYIVETRKAGCRSQRTTLTFGEQEERTVKLESPTPIYGKLRTESDPSGADVLLEGTLLGQTPGIFKDIPVGTHQLLFRKEGFEDKTEEVTVKEGQISAVSVELKGTAASQSEASPKSSPKGKASPKSSPNAKEEPLFNMNSFYADLHYQLGNPSAAGAALGLYLKGIHAEASYDLPLGASLPLYWTFFNVDGVASEPVCQEYKPASLISGNVGYGIIIGRRLRLTPRVGASVLSVTASAVTGGNAQQTYIFSGTASLRTEFALIRHLSLELTPVFSLPLQRGATAERLAAVSPDFNRWNNGFALRAGISINF